MATKTEFIVRPITPEDLSLVRSLWEICGLLASRSDTNTRLRAVVEELGDLFLVARSGDKIVGSIMGSFDGRRGWINRLVVHPDSRSKGLGAILLGAVEEALRAKGCDKVNLLIEPRNAAVQEYYARHGYCRDELVFMEKWLD